MTPETLADLSRKIGVEILDISHSKETKFVTVKFNYDRNTLKAFIPDIMLSVDKVQNPNILKSYVLRSIQSFLNPPKPKKKYSYKLSEELAL